jgi:hypothetical protein
VTTLTASGYRDLCALVGDALDHPLPVMRRVGSCGWPVTVDLLGHRHPVTDGFVVDYVGSTYWPRWDARRPGSMNIWLTSVDVSGIPTRSCFRSTAP